MNEINKDIRPNTFESVIEISNMFTKECHEFIDVFTIHRNNDLFTWRTLSGHVDMRLKFACFINCLVNIFYLFRWEVREIFFKFENVLDIPRQSLSISSPIFSIRTIERTFILVVVFQFTKFLLGRSRLEGTGKEGKSENLIDFDVGIFLELLLVLWILTFFPNCDETLL